MSHSFKGFAITKLFAILNRYAKFIPPALAVVVYILNNVYVNGTAQHYVTVATGILAALGVAGLTNAPTAAHLSLVQRLEAVEQIVAPFLHKKVVAPPVTTTAAPVKVADVVPDPTVTPDPMTELGKLIGT